MHLLQDADNTNKSPSPSHRPTFTATMSTRHSPHDIEGRTNSGVRALSFLDLPAELRNQVSSYMESLHADLCKTTPAVPFRKRVVDCGNTTRDDGAWWAHYAPAYRISSGIDFPAQPPITRVCRQIRNDTIPIFYGANDFVFMDSYWWGHWNSRHVRVETPFPAVLMRCLGKIRRHLHLIRKLKITATLGYSAQTAHDTVAILMDLDLPFEEGTLVAEDIDGRY